MNGRAARRIHRAALHVKLVGTGMAPSMGDTVRQIAKTLKRQYNARPYHKRNNWRLGYPTLSHKEQEQRWWGMRQMQVPKPPPKPKAGPYEELPFYDDHARFKFMEGR